MFLARNVPYSSKNIKNEIRNELSVKPRVNTARREYRTGTKLQYTDEWWTMYFEKR
jgi:hypothetical protein